MALRSNKPRCGWSIIGRYSRLLRNRLNSLGRLLSRDKRTTKSELSSPLPVLSKMVRHSETLRPTYVKHARMMSCMAHSKLHLSSKI